MLDYDLALLGKKYEKVSEKLWFSVLRDLVKI